MIGEALVARFHAAAALTGQRSKSSESLATSRVTGGSVPFAVVALRCLWCCRLTRSLELHNDLPVESLARVLYLVVHALPDLCVLDISIVVGGSRHCLT